MMKSQWTQAGERDAVERWGAAHGPDFALRVYSARLMGSDPALCLHGGGNVSVKGAHRTILGDEVEALFVKASGVDLATMGPDDLIPLDLASLRRCRTLNALSDEQMLAELRRHILNASVATPSVETLVHTLLPHRVVDHSHADAVLALANQVDAETMLREVLGERVAVLPYIRPGLELARAVAACIENRPDLDGIVLSHHGLITFADNVRTSYERHVDLVFRCERFAESRKGHRRVAARVRTTAATGERAARLAPMLRGLLASPAGEQDRPGRRNVLEWRVTDEILEFVESDGVMALASAGPVTGDHVVHTKPTPLVVNDLDWPDEAPRRRDDASDSAQAPAGHSDALRERLASAIERYKNEYIAYASRFGGLSDDADPLPCVVLVPGAGMFCRGTTKADARRVADLAEHTLWIKLNAAAIGQYQPFPFEHWYDAEFRRFQQAKARKPGPGAVPRPLEGQVVVISGGAGAIGAGIAEACADAGAHVAVTDLDADRIDKLVRRLEASHPAGTALGVEMDVTDERSVRNGYAEIVRTFGGVDVIVPNAGVTHAAPLDELDPAEFRRVVEVNATGVLLFVQEGVRVLKSQGLGGHVIINASKNVFAPGREFAAYSASKAAAHQLGKVAAIELAPFGIRVNMINADAVFGDEEFPSGLWARVGPARARAHGLDPTARDPARGSPLDQLAEFYRNRNLLKVRVLARHVGNAIVFFASNATPTTGATLPVDGGLPEAFPR